MPERIPSPITKTNKKLFLRCYSMYAVNEAHKVQLHVVLII